mmetsp:Transcript_18965/g.47305  ORF Transcript_18965/g.47305 Transcript_18965/m.47305 type:complete len:83 (+) Transcript_18965:439-687(+)
MLSEKAIRPRRWIDGMNAWKISGYTKVSSQIHNLGIWNRLILAFSQLSHTEVVAVSRLRQTNYHFSVQYARVILPAYHFLAE